MRRLGRLPRRAFGQGVGVSLALTLMPRAIAAVREAQAEVAIREFVFEPSELTIRRGDTVRWANFDIAPHTATSDDGDWDTGGLEQRESASIRFDTSGEFPYFCVYHPHMKGIVRVMD